LTASTDVPTRQQSPVGERGRLSAVQLCQNEMIDVATMSASMYAASAAVARRSRWAKAPARIALCP